MGKPTPITRTAADALADYHRDGTVVFRQVLPPDLMDEVRAHIAFIQRRHPAAAVETLGLHDAFHARLVSDPRLLAIGELFVGPDIGHFASHYLIKPPGTALRVPWHQDLGYWQGRLSDPAIVTLYLAVDDIDRENGGMQVIPGSHRAARDHGHLAELAGRTFDLAVMLRGDEAARARVVEMRAGDVEVHHPLLLHGSEPNASVRRRAALTIRYIPTDNTILEPRPWAWLLQGVDRGARHRWMPLPSYTKGSDFPFSGADDWNVRLAQAGPPSVG